MPEPEKIYCKRCEAWVAPECLRAESAQVYCPDCSTPNVFAPLGNESRLASELARAVKGIPDTHSWEPGGHLRAIALLLETGYGGALERMA